MIVWRNVHQHGAGVAPVRVGWLFAYWYVVGGSRADDAVPFLQGWFGGLLLKDVCCEHCWTPE